MSSKRRRPWDDTNLRDFASALTRSWLVIAVATVAGLIGGRIVSNAAHTVYGITSRVVVLAAPSVGTPEDVQHVASMIRSEMSPYQVLARRNDVTDRVTSQIPGMTASEVAGTTVVTTTDQVIMITVSLPSTEQSAAVAKALVTELTNEVRALHPGSQPLIRAGAMTAPVKPVSTGVGRVPLVFAGDMLGLAVGLVIVQGLASLRPKVASGGVSAASGRLVLRAKADQAASEQLAAVFPPHLKESTTEGVVLMGTGERTNLGPQCRGLGEQLGAEATTVEAIPNGADPITLRTMAGGEVTVVFADRKDTLKKVQETIDLLGAAGDKIAACLVVSDAQA